MMKSIPLSESRLPGWFQGRPETAPRYTSYPPATLFHSGIRQSDYAEAAARSQASGRPLSLYVHIPFCRQLCYYCACHKIVTRKQEQAREYLDYLKQEIALQAALFSRGRPVTQMHWGGGTPTYLSEAEQTELMYHLARHFGLGQGAAVEYSIEIDPRTVNPDNIALLKGLGFNRVSFGVQDFDPAVQKAVHRLQSEAQTRSVYDAARAYGFRSISIDLIYGLPLQTAASFERTVRTIIEMAPDRLSLFHYAHLPERFFPQSRIRAEDLPSIDEKLAILAMSQALLTDAGYVEIGMDHWAKHDDALARAQQAGSLHRNFQGYSTQAECDLIGLGCSSIGKIDNLYAQNAKALPTYYEHISRGEIPLERGYLLTPDDELRRQVIMTMLCHLRVDWATICRPAGVEAADYFASELAELAALPDGLVELTPQALRVLPEGKPYIRYLARLFDRHWLDNPSISERYSRVL